MRTALMMLAGLGVLFIHGSPEAAEVHVQVQDRNSAPVENAAVVIRALDDPPEPATGNEATIDQIDREFVPAAITVPVNTRIHFPNSDDIRHHVYSFSEAKSFELPLYMGSPARPIEFPRPGIVTIGCNIHDWMIGHIYVVDAALHGLTDTDGVWHASGVPAGRYRVEVWHHGLQEEQQEIVALDLETGGGVQLQATIEIAPGPSPRRPPRTDRYRYP